MTREVSPAAIRAPFASLDVSAEEIFAVIKVALAEDLGKGDVTTSLTVAEGSRARGTLMSKQKLVVAGLPVVARLFEILDPSVEWQPLVEDGAKVAPGTSLATITGPAATLLSGERVALNFLQHLSGIASLARRFKEELAGLKTELLDTRKTTPGLRALEKYAVRVGGGKNHRQRLDDAILIKNNHLRMAGGIRAAVEKARQGRAQDFPVEVEVTTLEGLEEAIQAGVDTVLLDNMTCEEVRKCVQRAAGRVKLEVSGGIDLGNIRAFAETGVDYISVGALTHSAPAADINFRIEPVA